MGGEERDLLSAFEGVQSPHITIAVRGPLPFHPGHAYFAIHRIGEPDRDSFDSGIDRVARFLQEAVTAYPIDPAQVFLAGFSQGSVVALSLSLTGVLKPRGVIAFHGYIPDFAIPGSVTPLNTAFFVSQGLRDFVFPVARGRMVARVLRERAKDVTYKEYPVGHSICSVMAADATRWLDCRMFARKPDVTDALSADAR